NNTRQEFTFNNDGKMEFNWNFPVPSIKIDESSGSLFVFDFFRYPVKVTPNAGNQNNIDQARINSPFVFPVPFAPPEKLSEHWKNKLDIELRSRKYSPRTRKAYMYYNSLICRTLQKPPEEIRCDDVTEFIALMEKNNEYSASAINLAVSAIKFFFRNVLKKDDIDEHHRPHQDGRLPMILSKEEVHKILAAEKNPKHRLLLMLVYSSGLRVSEVVKLKREHIDLSRKVIYIRQSKGRKDRSTLLSEKAARFIEEYYSFFEIEKWLFEGQPATSNLSIRSAQYIFDKALRNAKIFKRISIHNLRHTFATHLLESGTDIRYIQTLLGHANLRTTERYTHVAKRNVLNIKSPLDSI
ncbi:MAG: site-specific integrase, partial [Treponema sp.]|nr:site-specific integrase [Treponema sp.]